MLNRREFLGAGLGLGAAALGAYALPGDTFRWACTSGMGYDSWVSLDFDPLRPGEGDMEAIMSMRRKYLLENLKATLRS